jgi:hypothetical protein
VASRPRLGLGLRLGFKTKVRVGDRVGLELELELDLVTSRPPHFYHIEEYREITTISMFLIVSFFIPN